MEATITVLVSSFLLLSVVVDSFRIGAVWILSTRRLVVFGFDVIIVAVVIVVMNITVSRSPPPVQLEGMHRPRTAFTVAIAVAKARLFYRLFTLSSPRLAPPWRVSCQERRKPRTMIPAPTAPRPPRMISDGNTSSSSEQNTTLLSNARRVSCWILRVWAMQRRCSNTDGASTWRPILIRRG